MDNHRARDVVPGRRGKEDAKCADFDGFGKTVHRHEFLELLKRICGQIFVQIGMGRARSDGVYTNTMISELDCHFRVNMSRAAFEA